MAKKKNLKGEKNDKQDLPKLSIVLADCKKVILVSKKHGSTTNWVFNFMCKKGCQVEIVLLDMIELEKAKKWPKKFDLLVHLAGTKLTFEKF